MPQQRFGLLKVTNEMIMTELNVLPDDLKVQVIHYIRFLKSPFAYS